MRKFKRIHDGAVFTLKEIIDIYDSENNEKSFEDWLCEKLKSDFEEITISDERKDELLREFLYILDEVFVTIGGLQFSVIDDKNFTLTKNEYLYLHPDDKYELEPAYNGKYTRNIVDDNKN